MPLAPIAYFLMGALGITVASNTVEDIGDRLLPQKSGLNVTTIMIIVGGTFAAVYAARKYLK